MRVVTGSIFAIFWACVHADIASLNKFKESYATHLLTHLPSDANAAITGVALPSEEDLQPLWRWYRTVDASTKGLAKQVMDEAQGSQPLANSAVALADFKNIFDVDLKNFPGGAVVAAGLDSANAAAKWPLVAAVLGETEPTGDGTKAWKAYRALGADSQPPAKEMMEGEFLTLFKTHWAASFHKATTYKLQMALRANSISLKMPQLNEFNKAAGNGLTADHGKETSQIYRAVSESMRERLSRIMG